MSASSGRGGGALFGLPAVDDVDLLAGHLALEESGDGAFVERVDELAAGETQARSGVACGVGGLAGDLQPDLGRLL